ncbi:MAG: TolC family protein [Bacteroidales bacterium]|nr:TolC family protein [Bacteroidales bacterium]
MIKIKKIIFLVIGLIILISNEINSQSINDYIKEGLDNNIVLQQKAISLEHALYSLKTANAYFLPSIDFQGNYTTGEGGRYIPLPLGDLMNPIYTTLNNLTGSNSFPTIENKNISFFPKNFYDAKLRTTLPIINSDIYYNRKIQQQQVKLKEYEVDVYKRELVKNIKTAYYNYLCALTAIQIYSKATDILNENVRINQKLIENGKGLPATCLRAQSEREKVLVQFANAQNDEKNAKKYFNFLLNKNLESEIITTFSFTDSVVDSLMTSLLSVSDTSREELMMLKSGENISSYIVKMNKSYLIPKINAFIDLGSQSEDWKYNTKSRYYLTGIQVDFPIFSGGKNMYKTKQAVLDYKNAQLNYENTKLQLTLANEVAKSNLSSAWNAYQSSRLQLKSAQSYFNLIDKGFKEGVYSLIEFLDARNQLTLSELTVNINKYKIMIEVASVERETARYNFDNAKK